jgi:tetratricopeptide (TPR) repeat protein
MFSKIIPKLLLCAFLVGLSCVPVPRPAQEPLSFSLARLEPLVTERRYSEALAGLEEVAQIHADTPLPLIKIGQIYLTQHRWLLAEDAFNRALARDLDNPLAMAGLAEALFNQNRLSDALTWWQQATTTQPQLPGVFTGLGRTYLRLFDFEAARAAFAEQQTYTFDPEAQWFLAALDASLDLSAAVDALQAMTTQNSNETLIIQRDYLLATLAPFTAESSQVEIAKATGIALAQVELWPLAVHALTIANDTGVEDAETLAFLGHALAQAGKPALDLFEQAQALDPDSALPLYFQGIYLRQQGALKAAEDLLTRAVDLDEENAAIYVELARTKTQQGDVGTAELLYLSAVEVTEGDLEFRWLLAQFYAERGYRLAEAGIPAAEALIEADEARAEAYELLGRMQFLAGEPDGGEASLRQALELDPTLNSARYHLARLLETQGQLDLALAEYQRVIDWDTLGEFRERALKDKQRLRAQ